MSIIETPAVLTRYGRAICNSKDVASYFGKRHDHVLRDIDNVIGSGHPDLGSLFTERSDYHETARKMVRSFDMTKDGFTLLAMGFTGPRALQFKLAYIKRFNEMEEELREAHRSAYLGRVMVKEFQLQGERLRALNSYMSSNGQPNATVACRLLGTDESSMYPIHTPIPAKADHLTKMKVVSESGLYKLIMRSDKREAKAFQDWVTRKKIGGALRNFRNVNNGFFLDLIASGINP